MPPRICLCISIFVTAGVGFASVQTPSTQFHRQTLHDRERQIWRVPARDAEYSQVPHESGRPRCSDLEAPQALTTPDPFLTTLGQELKIRVNFIIGTDGRVHSPLILQSAGRLGDRDVLRTVRTWRYRPATCNGVPTEAEGNVEFSRH
jgi:TonB family protein